MKLLKYLCCGILCLGLAGCAEKEKPREEEPPVVEEKIDVIDNEYYISPDPSKVNNAMIRAFNQLSQDIADENVELSQVAKDVVVCFAYDFFTFKGKENQSDIGGLTYLPDEQADEFASFATNTFYKNYEKIINEYGRESLPEVTSVEITNLVEQEVVYQYDTYNGFVIDAKLTYGETKVDQAKLKTSIQVTCIDIVQGIIVITEVK